MADDCEAPSVAAGMTVRLPVSQRGLMSVVCNSHNLQAVFYNPTSMPSYLGIIQHI